MKQSVFSIKNAVMLAAVSALAFSASTASAGKIATVIKTQACSDGATFRYTITKTGSPLFRTSISGTVSNPKKAEVAVTVYVNGKSVASGKSYQSLGTGLGSVILSSFTISGSYFGSSNPRIDVGC